MATLNQTYIHTGTIFDTNSPPAPAGLRVEAWDAANVVPDLIAYAVTDADGRFEMRLAGEDVDALFGDQPAEVFFKVWKMSGATGVVLISTEGKQTWRITGATRRTRIVVNTNQSGNNTPPSFIVRGYIAHVDTGPYNGQQVTVEDIRVSGDVQLGQVTRTRAVFTRSRIWRRRSATSKPPISRSASPSGRRRTRSRAARRRPRRWSTSPSMVRCSSRPSTPPWRPPSTACSPAVTFRR
jgi:hypothetical protein